MIYEVYTTHVHYQETQTKKWTFLYFLKSVILVTTVSETVVWITFNLFPKFFIIPCNLKNN